MTHSLARKKVWFKMLLNITSFVVQYHFPFWRDTKEDSNFRNGCAIKVCVKGLSTTIFFLALVQNVAESIVQNIQATKKQKVF